MIINQTTHMLEFHMLRRHSESFRNINLPQILVQHWLEVARRNPAQAQTQPEPTHGARAILLRKKIENKIDQSTN